MTYYLYIHYTTVKTESLNESLGQEIMGLLQVAYAKMSLELPYTEYVIQCRQSKTYISLGSFIHIVCSFVFCNFETYEKAEAEIINKQCRVFFITLIAISVFYTQSADALIYTIKEGDILAKLADEYDSSISAIVLINDVRKDENLRVGAVIEIPQYLWDGADLPTDNHLSGQIDEKKVLSFKQIDPDAFLPTHKINYMIHGRISSSRELVKNDLEGAYYETRSLEDVVLRGTSNETWVAPLSKVLSTYTKVDGSPLMAADFLLDRYIELYAKPTMGNFAAFIPVGFIVKINTAWGDVLYANAPGVPHGMGDYLVCRADEKGEPDFSDVWVVNGVIFPHTYDMGNGR